MGEWCVRGSLEKYLSETKKKLEENEIALYGWQLLRGMDFLGDIGIAHRKFYLYF